MTRLSGRAPKVRVEALLAEEVEHLVGGFEADAGFFQALLNLAELDVHDLADFLALERLEHHDFVDAVQELGAHVLLEALHHFVAGAVHHFVVVVLVQLLEIAAE